MPECSAVAAHGLTASCVDPALTGPAVKASGCEEAQRLVHPAKVGGLVAQLDGEATELEAHHVIPVATHRLQADGEDQQGVLAKRFVHFFRVELDRLHVGKDGLLAVLSTQAVTANRSLEAGSLVPAVHAPTTRLPAAGFLCPVGLELGPRLTACHCLLSRLPGPLLVAGLGPLLAALRLSGKLGGALSSCQLGTLAGAFLGEPGFERVGVGSHFLPRGFRGD